MAESTNAKKIAITLLFFFIAGLCEIGGGYLVWLWLRDRMSWMLGALGGFVLFLYGVVPTFQPSHFHRIYAAYGSIFIVMALAWGWLFEGIAPDRFDIIGAVIALAGVAIIYSTCQEREREKASGEEVIQAPAPLIILAVFFVLPLQRLVAVSSQQKRKKLRPF